MTTDSSETIHIDDEALFRAIDPADDSPEALAARAHAETCETCAGAMARTSRTLARVSAEIAAIALPVELIARFANIASDAAAAREGAASAGEAPEDPPRPSPRAPSKLGAVASDAAAGTTSRILRSVWLKAAILAGLLLAPVLASGGVRSWIVAVFDGQADSPSDIASPADPSAAADGERSRTIRLPAASTIRLEFTALDPASTLAIVRVDDDDQVELHVPIEPAAATPLVFDAGVRVENTTAAEFRLLVPHSVTRVLVTRADGSSRTLPLGTDLDSLRVLLSAR